MTTIRDDMEKACGPDYSRKGVFQDHNCWRCKSGELPCVKGNPRDCETLHARND
jgi:hypothetical protein